LAGCSSINRETHYIKAVDSLNYPVNYFRVNVKGSTALSSSRYLSGYFPDSAVDIYFGQIPQPKDAKFVPIGTEATSTGSAPATDAKTAAVSTASASSTSATVVGPPAGTKLVLLLSSRADAVADEISDIARNEELMRNITKLIYKDELRASQDASYDQQITRSRLDALLTIGDSSIANLSDKATADVAATRLLLFVNQLAFHFGNQSPFTSLDEAAAWYDRNRDTLVGRGQR
jgi:hypothetical protein